jgi:hypothetical protein
LDRSFLFARNFDPTAEDARMYQKFVDAALKWHVNLGLTIPPKVHLIVKHV